MMNPASQVCLRQTIVSPVSYILDMKEHTCAMRTHLVTSTLRGIGFQRSCLSFMQILLAVHALESRSESQFRSDVMRKMYFETFLLTLNTFLIGWNVKTMWYPDITKSWVLNRISR